MTKGFRASTLGVLVGLALGLAGCVTTDEKAGEKSGIAALDPALLEQPRFSPGDFYRFDNPDAVWRVAALEDGDLVRWELEAGRGQLTYQHPLFPPLEWWNEGPGNGRRLISDITGDVFPMRVGARMTFLSTVSADTPPHAWEYPWSCEVLREEEVSTQIGRFATLVVQCGRVQPDEYVFWYAPEAGFYVRYRVTRFGQPPITRELIGFRNAVLATRSEALAKRQVPGPDGIALEAPPSTARVASVAPVEPAAPPATPPSAPAPTASAQNTQSPQTAVAAATAASAGPIPLQPRAPGPAPVRPADPPPQAAAQQGTPQATAEPARRAEVPVRTQAAATEIPSAPAQTLADVPPGAATARQGAAAPLAAGPVPGAGTGIGLHLASYKDRGNAERGWLQLLSRNEDVLRGLSPTYQEVTLADRGTFIRLVAGPVPEATRAEAMCGTLKARGAYCQVLR